MYLSIPETPRKGFLLLCKPCEGEPLARKAIRHLKDHVPEWLGYG